MSAKKLLSKKIIGNKLCVPNQIEIERTRVFGRDILKKIGLCKRSPSSRFCIKDYFKLGDTKIIGITRDGNDVILSNMRRGKKSFRTSSYRWWRSVEIIHELKYTYGDRIMVLSFEDLVTEPESVMRRVTEFLGVPYDEAMLEGYKFSTKYPEAEIVKNKAFVHKEENFDLDLEHRFPAVFQKYEELHVETRGGLSP